MIQEVFAVEQYMDKYETVITHNMGETCCDSISLNDIIEMGSFEKQEIYENLSNMKLTYGHITGSPSLKQQICQLYDSATPEQVVITNGAIGANFLALYSIVCPGDTVIVIQPTYQQLSSVPKMFGAKVVIYDLKFEENFLPNLSDLKRLFEQYSPKLLIFNNPNNPSGAVASDSLMKSLIGFCQNHDTYLMCDEVYRPLYHNITEKPKSALDYGYGKVIVTSSMSKAWSLAGIRLGWVITNDKSVLEDLLDKRHYNMISISMVDDYIATLALKVRDKIISRNEALCNKNLKILQEFIDKNSQYLSWVKPTGGSTCFIKLNNINSHDFCVEMAEKFKTLIVPGEVFERPGYIRVGFGNSTTDIVNGLTQIEKYLQTLQ